jgi:O-antigen/teichoic acid export membrane protein
MPDDPRVREELLAQIEARREGIAAFLHDVRPRRNRLTNISIISSAMAALFVAGPALAGPQFTDGVKQELSLSSGASVWRALCLAALIVSMVSVISANMSKSQDLAARVTAAEVCNTELEGVMTSLHFGHLSVEEAIEQYHQYVSKVPFVEELPDTSRSPRRN